MKAVVYDVPRQVSVEDLPDARKERPTDVLVRKRRDVLASPAQRY